jgi:hypothetical protein
MIDTYKRAEVQASNLTESFLPLLLFPELVQILGRLPFPELMKKPVGLSGLLVILLFAFVSLRSRELWQVFSQNTRFGDRFQRLLIALVISVLFFPTVVMVTNLVTLEYQEQSLIGFLALYMLCSIVTINTKRMKPSRSTLMRD